MAFRFARSGNGAGYSVRRIATELVEKAAASIADENVDPALRIHTARKTVKKLRGLIRLVGPRFKAADAELDSLRDIAALVGPVRETATLLATFDSVAALSDLAPKALEDLRTPLAEAVSANPDAESLAAFAGAIRDFATRIEGWHVARNGFSALAPGLERSFARAQDAFDEIDSDASSPEALHKLRKRVKDHWYQARLLKPIWPEMMEAHIAAADEVGQILGLVHDIDKLLSALPATVDGAALAATATAERNRLLGMALPLCRRLLAGKPGALSARWRIWWKAWASA